MLVFGIISLLPARAFFMLKFYILISSNVGALLRHFSPHYAGLSYDDAEVVINTKDEEFERDAIHFCEEHGIVYHITESNGTPAKGKNELLKIFEASDNEYCVQIDGDDYLTPHGVWLYKKIARSTTVPDAICLHNQISLCSAGELFDGSKEVRRFFTIEWDKLDYEDMFAKMVQKGLPENDAKRYVDYHKDYYTKQQKYCEKNDAHCRVVFMSKKAAKYKFPEDLTIGEDTIQFYHLKDAHMRKELTMVCNDEAPATYIYNQLDGWGTVFKHTKAYTEWGWMGDFNEWVEILETQGKLHEKALPELRIHYTEGFVLDDLETAGLCRYEKEGLYVDLPANATQESINYHLIANGQSIEK